MILEATVERASTRHRVKNHIKESTESSFAMDNDEKPLTLQELLLLMIEQHQKELVALDDLSKKKQKKKEEKTLSTITDIQEIEQAEEKSTDQKPFVNYTDGMEHFQKQLYQQILETYALFLSEYLNPTESKHRETTIYSYATSNKEEDPRPVAEVTMLTHEERHNYVRGYVMNTLTGGVNPEGGLKGSSHGSNYIDPGVGNSWELWRIFQHNQIISFWLTSEWRH